MSTDAYLEQPLDSGLSLTEVADDTAGAVAFLAHGGAALRLLNRANVFCRVLLGRQLLVVQERQLWAQMPIGDEQNAARGGYRSWDDFMTNAFPQITGLSHKTGYAAVMLAKSQALQKLPEADLRKFENLSNAIQLVKLERKGVVISAELIGAAQGLPVEAFRQMTGSGKRVTVEVVVDSSDVARALEPIVAIFKMAEPDALLGLQEVVRHAMLQAGGNPSDAVDCIVAACQEQWRQEGLPELAAVGSLTAK
jgi:hypothetical protein